MAYLKCTRKVLDKLGLKTAPKVPEVIPDGAALGDWYVHCFRLERRTAVVFINERTLFTVLVPGVTKPGFAKLGTIFREALAAALGNEGYPEERIARVLEEYTALEIARTSNRSILGTLNDIVFQIELAVEDDFDGDLAAEIMRINRGPLLRRPFFCALDALLEVLPLPGHARHADRNNFAAPQVEPPPFAGTVAGFPQPVLVKNECPAAVPAVDIPGAFKPVLVKNGRDNAAAPAAPGPGARPCPVGVAPDGAALDNFLAMLRKQYASPGGAHAVFRRDWIEDWFKARAAAGESVAEFEIMHDDLFAFDEYCARCGTKSVAALPWWEYSLMLEWVESHFLVGDRFDLTLKNARRFLGNLQRFIGDLAARKKIGGSGGIDEAYRRICGGRRLVLVRDIPFTGAEEWLDIVPEGKRTAVSFRIVDFWLILLYSECGRDWTALRARLASGWQPTEKARQLDDFLARLKKAGRDDPFGLLHQDVYRHELEAAWRWVDGLQPSDDPPASRG